MGTGAAIAQPETQTAIAQFKPYSRSLLPKRGETPAISCGQQQPLPQRGKGAVIATKQMRLILLTNRFPSERVNKPSHFRVRTEHKPSHGDTAVIPVNGALQEPRKPRKKTVSQPQSGGKKRMSRRTPTCTYKV